MLRKLGALMLAGGLLVGAFGQEAFGHTLKGTRHYRISVIGHFPCLEDEILLKHGRRSLWLCEAADDLGTGHEGKPTSSRISGRRIHVRGSFPCGREAVLMGKGDYTGKVWSKGWKCTDIGLLD